METEKNKVRKKDEVSDAWKGDSATTESGEDKKIGVEGIPSKGKRISSSFSAVIVSRLQDEAQNQKGIGVDEIANVLEVEPETIKRIKDGEEGFTVEQLVKIEKAFGNPISSLLLREVEEKKNPTDVQDECEDLIKLLKTGDRLRRSST